jgi:tetratricopeptide (TPR) repeat protein
MASIQIALLLLLVPMLGCGASSSSQLPSARELTQPEAIHSRPPSKAAATKELALVNVDRELAKISDAKDAFRLALRYDRNRKWEAALRAYEKTLALDSSIVRARINLGLVAIQLGKLELAERECTLVLGADELISMAHYCIAETRVAQNKLSSAITSYIRALALRTQAPLVRLAFARALIKKGQTENGLLQLTQTASEAADRPDILLHVAQELIALKRTDEAIGTYLDLLKRTPDHYLGHMKLARLLVQTSSASSAGAYFEKANLLRPNEIKPVLALVEWSFGLGLFGRAKAYLRLSKSCTIKRSEAHLKLARYFWHFEQWSEAQDHIALGLSKPAPVRVTRSLERMKRQIDAGEKPRAVIPYRSPKKRTPLVSPPKSRTPAK